jgi:pimeloyl-ACP methyl ester carboxylesterase
MWDRVAASLVDRYRLITFDLRGHGRSTPADRYDVPSLLTDLDRVVTTSKADPGTLLVGHSLGPDYQITTTSFSNNVAKAMAGVALMAVPTVAVFAYLQKHLVRSLMTWAEG